MSMAVLFIYNNCGLKFAFMFAYPFRMKSRKSVLILRFSLMSLFSLSLPPLSLPFLLYSSSLFPSFHLLYVLTHPLDLFLFTLPLFPLSSTLPFLYTLLFFLFPPSSSLYCFLLCYLTPPPSSFFIYSLVNAPLLSSLNFFSFCLSFTLSILLPFLKTIVFFYFHVFLCVKMCSFCIAVADF